jgi:glyoxylate utilization-related uncharacterized protein
MTADEIAKVRALESVLAGLPQLDLETIHTLHGGIYTRTIMMPAGSMLTGALVKIQTTVIVQGECTVFIGGRAVELSGYTVCPAGAGRKQAFAATSDTFITMMFPTSAQTVEQAETELTDEHDLLSSHSESNRNLIAITGVLPCHQP